MCYGDINYGGDGHYRQWAENQEQQAEERRHQEQQQELSVTVDYKQELRDYANEYGRLSVSTYALSLIKRVANETRDIEQMYGVAQLASELINDPEVPYDVVDGEPVKIPF